MLENLRKPEPVQGSCKIASIRETLNESDRDILDKALNDDSWAAKPLAKALRQLGITVSDTTILRHRRRECICD
jgi:hypothetical protein